jgi:hypothetical protein
MKNCYVHFVTPENISGSSVSAPNSVSSLISSSLVESVHFPDSGACSGPPASHTSQWEASQLRNR